MMPPDANLDAALARFGHSAFRPGQREAIETLLGAGRLLLVAPTGGGKSLCYQLPAALLPGTTLVVSPLIALMQDQVAALERAGVAATYLASTLDAGETRRRMAAIARGELDLVYVAPERLALPGFRALLADLACPLVAVDEAHCISEWGHDFRPEYLEIGAVVETLRPRCLLACTATATPVVRDEILARLGLPADTPQMVRGFARPNLSLRAHEVGSRRERDAAVDAALAEALGGPGSGRGTAIVYAPTRRGAEEEAARLGARGFRVACYHAGLAAEVRDTAQRGFREGALEVVVATNAFGMGIDRPDVRAVVHLGPPGSLEAYYQEVGRAGRDGARALGLLLHRGADLPLRRHLIESGADGKAPPPEVIEHKWNLFLELVRWAEGGSCRHDAILRYFGDEAETLAGCGICDVCARLAEAPEQDAEETTLRVRKLLSGVARVHGRFGLKVALKLVRGESDERLARSGLDRVPTFGTLRDEPAEWLERVARRLVTAGWVSFEGGERPVVVLTEPGRRVMRGELPARIVLPGRAAAGAGPRGARLPAAARGARSAGAAPAELDAAASALFEALRAWRLDTARSAGVPPYVVASDRSLREIALFRPRSRDELQLAHGIGPTKAERYGAAILEVVRAGAPADG
jgi:ATP-dependent DNA helicase RecQ